MPSYTLVRWELRTIRPLQVGVVTWKWAYQGLESNLVNVKHAPGPETKLVYFKINVNY